VISSSFKIKEAQKIDREVRGRDSRFERIQCMHA
jgi:hypothetical protein